MAAIDPSASLEGREGKAMWSAPHITISSREGDGVREENIGGRRGGGSVATVQGGRAAGMEASTTMPLAASRLSLYTNRTAKESRVASADQMGGVLS